MMSSRNFSFLLLALSCLVLVGAQAARAANYKADGAELPAGPHKVSQELGVPYWPERNAAIPIVTDRSTGKERPRYRLILNVFKPEGVAAPAPGIFLVHGGGFGSGSPDMFHGNSTIGPWLTSHGYVVFSLGYTLGSGDGRRIANIDARQAIRFVKVNAQRFNVDPDRLGAWGWSAGGMLFGPLVRYPDGGSISVTNTVDGKRITKELPVDGGTLQDKANSTLKVLIFSSGLELQERHVPTLREDHPKAIFSYQAGGEKPHVRGAMPADHPLARAFAAKGIHFENYGVEGGKHCPRIGLTIKRGGKEVTLHDAIFAFLETHLKP